MYSAGGGGASKLPSYTSFAILKYDKIVGLYISKKCLIRLFSNYQPGTNRQQILQDALQDLCMKPPESKSREKVLGSTVRTHLPWQERMFYLFVFLYSILCIFTCCSFFQNISYLRRDLNLVFLIQLKSSLYPTSAAQKGQSVKVS